MTATTNRKTSSHSAEDHRPRTGLAIVDLRAKLLTWAHDSEDINQRSTAEALAVCAVESYWQVIAARKTPLRLPTSTLRQVAPTLRSEARRFGEAVAELPVAQAAHHLSLLYTALLPAAWRASRGVYFTPPSLAERLLDQAERAGLDWSRAHVLDPAAGAGAFLVPVAQRMLRALHNCAPAIALQNISSRIRGFEIDPFAAWLAGVFVEAAAIEHVTASGRRLGSIVEVQDSLSLQPTAQFDLVIANPPFGRVVLTKEQRQRFARSLYGHANQYAMFLDLGVRFAKDGGLASFLTPSSFLAGEYFKNLRSTLWKTAPPIALDFVALRKGVFEDVLQETILATFKKAAKRGPISISHVTPRAANTLQVSTAGQCSLPRCTDAPWLLPRHKDEVALANRLRMMPSRLRDWGYKVSTGPLVWNRFKPQLSDKKDGGAIPLIWAECITADGQFVFRSAKRNHKPYFKPTAADNWLIVNRPCVLLQRTTAKEQARRLIAAEMPRAFLKNFHGVTVENHLNMLIPVNGSPQINPTLLAAFLNTSAADRAFRCISGSVAVSAYELENLPIPDADSLLLTLGPDWKIGDIEDAAQNLYLLGSKA